MKCLNPVILRNGYVVPCGKCELCRSSRRNEWSIRLGVETKFSDRMPLFITLTYDDEHLPCVCPQWHDLGVYGSCTIDCKNTHFGTYCHPTLNRKDTSLFLKAYKRAYNLDDENFHYFGCGEYGDQFGRPHYHLLFFGDEILQDLFDRNSDLAVKRLKKIWKYGNVHICQAGFDGIHYCTKYCMKEYVGDLLDCQEKPFTISSKNLGSAWFDSQDGMMIKNQCVALYLNLDKIYDMVDFLILDKTYLKKLLDKLDMWIPKLEVELDSGDIVPLPRYFRKKLIGQFEHWKDNPFWLYRHIQSLYDSLVYYETNGQFDQEHDVEAWRQQLLTRVEKINRRLINRNKKLCKKSKYEGI